MSDSRPRTLLVANPGADVYGSDLQMLETVSAMIASGWRVVVVLPGEGAGPLRERLAARGAEITTLRYPVVRRAALTPGGFARLGVEAARDQFAVTGLLRRLRPDVVLVNTMTIPWWISGARLARVPVICHVHEAEDADRRPVVLGLNAPLLLADLVIANSLTSKRAAEAAYPSLARKVVVVHNGIDDRPTPPIPADFSARPFRLVTVSRLSARKGIDVAVHAVERLRESGQDVELDIVGTPFPGYEWYEQELREAASRPALRDAVTFRGYISPVWPAIDRAQVALFPSLRESLGNAVVEAQLSLRPVIATATTGHMETVEDEVTGLQVPLSDADALADAVLRLMRDPELARGLADRGRRSALERFSVERFCQEVEKAIESVARR
jgi:glycosyltransferase involved in cell wall biosynthesis